ncbi:hypothetical protein [Megasphaera sp.]|uniref:hypothetical protein n=1 Tax=Megasphaera sp. TaxID=2023260 RepID=UPI003078FCC3
MEKDEKRLKEFKSLVDEANNNRSDRQKIAAHVDVVLFFSYDIVGSTKYKALHPGSWAGEIKKAFESIKRRVNSELSEAYIWRVLGDEIIFVLKAPGKRMKVSEETVLSDSVAAIYKVLQSATDEIEGSTREMSLKAAAWIGIVSDEDHYEKDNKIPKEYKNLFYKYTVDEERRRKIFEFMGNDIDAGFRIKQFTYSRQLVLSFELAYLINKIISHEESKNVELIHMGYKALNGIWHDRPYPIIWYYDKSYKKVDFLQSLPYDAETDNSLIKDYGLKHSCRYNFKKKELFEKIANDLGLCDKLMIIKQTLKNVEKSIEINDWLYNEDELHLHLAAVCCDFKNKRVFIAKRSTARGKYSACWEFGCAKANKSQGYIECIKKEYENDFGLKIKIMVSSDRGEQCPTPYALYEIKENGEEFQSDKGIIVYAKIMNDNIDEFANKKDYKKHECSLLLTEEAARKFLSENEKSVPDFKDTIMHAFDIMKKDEEDYQWR